MISIISSNDILVIGEKLQWPRELISDLLQDLERILKDNSSYEIIQKFQIEFGSSPEAIKNVLDFQNKTRNCPNTFLLFCVIAVIPKMLKDYRLRGIPEEFAWDILKDILIWTNDFRKKNGYYGFNKISWVCNHLSLKIFQIKGFQFEPREFNLPYYVFQNIKNKQLLIVCKSGMQVNRDGLIFDTLDSTKIRNVTAFKVAVNQFSGYEVTHKGYVSSEQKSWLLNDWQLITKPEDPYICFHIPEGSKLTLVNLNEAFKSANLFFAKYMPDFEYKVFATKSWIFDDQIADYLPDCNIAKFQSCIHLLPVLNGNEEQFLERVFGDSKVDWKNFKPGTQMQKIGVMHMQAGKSWRMKSFILHKDDLPLKEKRF